MKTMKWTQDHRRHVYRCLLCMGGVGARPDHEFLEKMVRDLKTLGLKTSVGGVGNQIAWSTTQQEFVGNCHMRTWVNNVSAALEVGYITTKELPKQVIKQHDVRRKARVAA